MDGWMEEKTTDGWRNNGWIEGCTEGLFDDGGKNYV